VETMKKNNYITECSKTFNFQFQIITFVVSSLEE